MMKQRLHISPETAWLLAVVGILVLIAASALLRGELS
jgi:hypothetical protein